MIELNLLICLLHREVVPFDRDEWADAKASHKTRTPPANGTYQLLGKEQRRKKQQGLAISGGKY